MRFPPLQFVTTRWINYRTKPGIHENTWPVLKPSLLFCLIRPFTYNSYFYGQAERHQNRRCLNYKATNNSTIAIRLRTREWTLLYYGTRERKVKRQGYNEIRAEFEAWKAEERVKALKMQKQRRE